MIRQNKGEWSELYVFLKLLGDGVLYAADSDLNKIDDLYYPLIAIIRDENSKIKKYKKDDSKINIFDEAGEQLLSLSMSEFKIKSESLLQAIKNSHSKTFDLPAIENFMKTVFCSKVKADSADKSDITVVLHDNKTYTDTPFGFSIKSKLGNPSTLLNAGKTTNFIYEITGNLSERQINEINGIDTHSKIRDRLNKLSEFNCELEYCGMENENFKSNLQMIDTQFPCIISEYLIQYYSGKSSLISELTPIIRDLNPCCLNTTSAHKYYEYKIKNFLTDVALGMTPAQPWTGDFQATGGYIIVREDGEILCYHIYNHNEFQEYLFKNTRFETASTGRYEFGTIYTENGKNYIKLNLQVRFI
jgi:hypothetical protein